jgi:hypothetical protein
MIGRTQRAAALHTVFVVWNNFGDHGFLVDLAGRHYRPLKDAETLGWVRFYDRDRVKITEDGKTQAMQYATVGVDA